MKLPEDFLLLRRRVSPLAEGRELKCLRVQGATMAVGKSPLAEGRELKLLFHVVVLSNSSRPSRRGVN